MIKRLRLQHRLGRQVVADRAGVSAGYLRQIEDGYDPRTGKEIRPHPDVLSRIGDVLDDSYLQLMVAARYLPEWVLAVEPGELHEVKRPRARGTEPGEMPPRFTAEEVAVVMEAVPEAMVEVVRRLVGDAVVEVLKRKGVVE